MQTYTNIAFISYKREDERWAKWLQRKLEHYRIPSIVCEENPNAPKKLRPIFRDKTDLVAGTLEGGLRQALLDSHFLIVICSPNATKSDYVNLEAQTFVDAGRAADIIPFIVKGTPYAKDKAQECYPKALLNLPKKQELLGVNIQEVGKQKALVRVAAHILEVRFDTLWGRYRRFLIRMRILLAVLIVLVLGAAAFVWDYTRTKHEYYADYVIKYGIPEGIIPLTEKDLNHTSNYYQFDYVGWKLKRITHCDWFGNPAKIGNTELTDRYPIQELSYENGVCMSIVYFDELNSPIMRGRFADVSHTKMDLLNYYNGNAILLNGRTNQFDWRHNTNDEFNFKEGWPEEKSNIGRFSFLYDEDGYLIRKVYNPIGRDILTSDQEGIAGVEYHLDSLHRVQDVIYLNNEMQYCSDAQGVSSKHYSYHPTGTMEQCEYFDIYGSRTKGFENAAIIKGSRDKYGNLEEERFFDEDEKACLNRFGYHLQRFFHSKDSVSYSFYDCNNQSCLLWRNDIAGIHKIKYCYNKNGDIIEICFYGTDGLPCRDVNGIYCVKATYDLFHRMKRVIFTKPNGELENNSFGYAIIDFSFDNHSRLTKRRYYNAQSTLLYYEQKEYKNGLLSKTRTFNAFNFPMCYYLYDNTTGYEIERNDIGQIKQITFLNTNDSPMCCNSGFAIVKYSYDANNYCTKMEVFDTDGETRVSNVTSKVAIQERIFDEKGHVVIFSQYDEWGNLIDRKSAKYTSNGLCREMRIIDADEQLTIDQYGVAKYIRTYDKYGRVSSEQYFGADNERVLHDTCGFSKIEYGYNERSFISDNWGYNQNLERSLSPIIGAWHTHKEYDEKGNVVQVSFYDTNDMPCKNRLGYHKAQYTWHRFNIRSGERYLDENDSLINVDACGYAYYYTIYDECDRPIEMSFFNQNRMNVNNVQGWHRQISRYHKSGLQEFNAFYDKDNNLVSINGQPPRRECYYNDNGIVLLEQCYNEQGEITQENMNIIDAWGGVSSTIHRNHIAHKVIEYSFSNYDVWGTEEEYDERQKELIFTMDSLSNITSQLFADL
ncbi:MAG: toll/interleukin-1 receptor domain-containing protein [Bacteroidales bacterium]|nr:toll/interleukin-1 receptor domain-containing protein [Candidatus Colicola equi]